MTEPGHRHSTEVLTFTGCPDGLCFWPQTLQQNFCFLTNQHTFNPQLVAKRDQWKKTPTNTTKTKPTGVIN